LDAATWNIAVLNTGSSKASNAVIAIQKRTAAKSTLLSASTTIVWLIDKTLAPKKADKQ
jgi:hypothetical protein